LTRPWPLATFGVIAEALLMSLMLIAGAGPPGLTRKRLNCACVSPVCGSRKVSSINPSNHDRL
jgi:hypothetical protein